MAKDFWLNLPVKNLQKSKDFFTKLGFKFNTGPGNTPTSAPLQMGSKEVMVMLFEESIFKGFVNQDINDTSKTCEVLLSFGANSKEEVDEIARKSVEAGGKSSHQPYPMEGPIYGCVFSDIDGHKWNVLYLKS